MRLIFSFQIIKIIAVKNPLAYLIDSKWKYMYILSLEIILCMLAKWKRRSERKKIPAASACLDRTRNDDEFEKLGFETLAAATDLNRLMIGLSSLSWNCMTCPSTPEVRPSQGAVCMNWLVSTSLCKVSEIRCIRS